MLLDRLGREIRPGDRVVAFFEMGSLFVPSIGFVHTKQSGVLENYRILLACDSDNVCGDHHVLTAQLESIEPDSGARDANGFELRVGDEVRLWDGGYMQIPTIGLLYYLRDHHGDPIKRTTPPTE